MHPYHHALSSVKKHGGSVGDYLPIHEWFDQSKSGYANFRHRAARHHSEGIYWAEEFFGVTITNSQGKVIPTRFIGEQHVMEDLGRIPSLKDWLMAIRPEKWMYLTPRSIEQTSGILEVPEDDRIETGKDSPSTEVRQVQG